MENKEDTDGDVTLESLSKMNDEELLRLVKRGKELERKARNRKQNQALMEEFVPDLVSGGPDRDTRTISIALAEDKLSILQFCHNLGTETSILAWWVPSWLGPDYMPALFSGFDFTRPQFEDFTQALQNLVTSQTLQSDKD